MFFIVNKTKKHVSLPDIKISLGPKQAIDLDKIMKREVSENSRHLKAAKANGDIEIRVKDDPRKPIANTSSEVRRENSSNEIDELKKEIKELSQTIANSGRGGISKEDLLEALKSIPQQTTVIHQSASGQKCKQDQEVEEVEMDNETLSQISARAVDKNVKGSKVKAVHYKEEKQNNSILHNIEELDGLL